MPCGSSICQRVSINHCVTDHPPMASCAAWEGTSDMQSLTCTQAGCGKQTIFTHRHFLGPALSFIPSSASYCIWDLLPLLPSYIWIQLTVGSWPRVNLRHYLISPYCILLNQNLACFFMSFQALFHLWLGNSML